MSCTLEVGEKMPHDRQLLQMTNTVKPH